MKTIFTLLVAAGMSLVAQAGPNDGIINFTSLSRNDISVEVDGRQYINLQNGLTIRDLSPGSHTVRVYTQVGTARKQMLYSRKLQVKPRLYIDFIINRFNKVFVDEQVMSALFREDDNRPNDNRYNDNRPGNSYGRVMNDQSFLAFKQTVSKESFDNSRMTIAKQVIDQNWFNTEQAGQLVKLFSFDQSRVEMAKYLYGRTVDKENYFLMYNMFDFSKSKEELANYIKNYK
jgi:hypothetical protein